MLKEVKIELTNRCSRNCKHCSSSATGDVSNIQELDFKDVVRILHESQALGVETIVFTGGEPLMYPYINQLIQLTSTLGMQSILYSFAYRNEKNLMHFRTLIKLGLNKIIYSLADTLSEERDLSTYDRVSFFDAVFKDNDAKLGFHYAVSKDSIQNLQEILEQIMQQFDQKSYFDKISLLRFVPHGRGLQTMDLSKNELLFIRDLYLSSKHPNRIRLGSPWNILGIKNSPCIIADEIMIIGFDGIAYPCDSIKYFKELGISGNIRYNTLSELYNSEYFTNLRKWNIENSCSACSLYSICRSGCIGQKIIANYELSNDSVKMLRKCIDARDPRCLQ